MKSNSRYSVSLAMVLVGFFSCQNAENPTSESKEIPEVEQVETTPQKKLSGGRAKPGTINKIGLGQKPNSRTW